MRGCESHIVYTIGSQKAVSLSALRAVSVFWVLLLLILTMVDTKQILCCTNERIFITDLGRSVHRLRMFGPLIVVLM